MDRESAARAGHRTYAGSPCKHGHDGERYVADNKCVHCVRARVRAREDYYRDLQRRAAATASIDGTADAGGGD